MKPLLKQRMARQIAFTALPVFLALVWGSRPLQAAEPPVPPEEGAYHRPITGGDRIRVTVEQDHSMDRVYAVAGDGTIDFGFAGRIRIAGLTADEVENLLVGVLEDRYFKKATVTVSVAEFVEGGILILGEVNNPGRIDFSSDSLLTVLEAVTMVGGLTRSANGSDVRVLRWGSSGTLKRDTISVDLERMLNTLDFSQDEYLRPRDMIVVPKLGDGVNSREFLALGAVQKPGFHQYEEGMNLIRAISRFGGLSKEAALDSASILRADGQGGYDSIRIDFSRLLGAADMSQNVDIRPGDIIYAPSTEQAMGGRVYILGTVPRPGAYPIRPDRDNTVAKVLMQAGAVQGFDATTGAEGGGSVAQFANLKKVRIVRKTPSGEKQELVVDVRSILRRGTFEDDVPLKDGDVIIIPDKVLNL